MGVRHSKRISCHFDAMIISAGKTYDGFIENFSEEGLEYLMTSVVRAPKDFAPEKKIQLTFPVSSEETINLNCEAVWFMRGSTHHDTLIGMKIINPPQRYKDLIKDYV